MFDQYAPHGGSQDAGWVEEHSDKKGLHVLPVEPSEEGDEELITSVLLTPPEKGKNGRLSAACGHTERPDKTGQNADIQLFLSTMLTHFPCTPYSRSIKQHVI